MNNIFKIAITFFLVINFMHAQQPHKPSDIVAQKKSQGITFQDVNLFSLTTKQKANVQIPKEVKEYTIFSLNSQKFASFKSNVPEAMNLEIPGQKSAIVLELVKVDITTENFEVIEMPSGKKVVPDKTISHYRGVVKGNPNSIAAISLSGDEVAGVVSLEGRHGNLVIGQLDHSKAHIAYQDEDISYLNEFACRLVGEENMKEYTEEQLFGNANNKAAAKCPEIFFDIDTDIVQDKGGSQGASNFIQSVFNQVATLYSNENITIKLSGMKTWTSSKPFSNTLDSYRAYRNQNSFNGDLGHFVTYNFSGGVAWVNALCGSRKYAVSGIDKNYSNVPTYSWSVGVVAHELGHNFGSHHTHACRWNGNNTAIDGCYTTEGGCAKPAIPSGGGTIMSYCHLTNVGINFTKGFGSQPANVMRNFISSSSCVGTCGGGGCSNGDAVTVTFRNNTNCTLQYFRNNASQFSINSGQTRQVSTTVGTNWEVKNTTNSSVDSFAIQCNQNEYTSTDNCSGGGGTSCDGVRPWSASVTYSSGDRVTYQGRLYEWTGTSWNNLGACPSAPSDPCAGIAMWSSTTTYSAGNQVTFEGSLYEWTGARWNNLGACGAARSQNISPPMNGKNTKELDVSAYPNPVHDILTVEIKNLFYGASKLSIKDVNGRTLKEIELRTSPGGKAQHTIDVSALSRGMYFVQVSNAKRTTTKKISIK
ncbi:M12 family metallo-peptidase [Aquimarina sp. I32.4]|uniref:M12 family metallo-peptidase n=1 Tax=Aquimarina sp. I32.4 TaxID=2053903 RepID=UPI000CDED146|nr:M12 family metallo-peptidase [Aquimarina sp. I32.4]